MAIYPNIYQTLVPCPIVELRGYLAACGLKGRLYAYLDYNGPTGTSRHSGAEGLLALAAEKQKLLPGQAFIEAPSGSFAMALALAGRTAGHPVVLTMPEDAPALRQEYLADIRASMIDQLEHTTVIEPDGTRRKLQVRHCSPVQSGGPAGAGLCGLHKIVPGYWNLQAGLL